MKKVINNKFFVISLIIISITSASLFALPGIQEYLKTESGQYVYYRDYRIESELYTGILYFDESTIETRYLLVDDKNGNKSMSIYFTMNPYSKTLELTGERLPDNTTNEDVEIINYLHSFLYDISICRTKLNGHGEKDNFIETVDFPYFGGQVQVVANNKIPVFGIESVEDFSGKPLLKAVTMGSISSSADLSFENFSGFKFSKSKTKSKKLNQKQMESFVWQNVQNTPNAKTLGNDANMIQIPIDIPKSEFEKRGVTLFEYFTRTNQLSQDFSYTYLPNSKIIEKENILVSVNQVYCPEEKNPYRYCVKILEKTESDVYLSIITVFEKFYLENKQYFDSLY